jgi:hypothetical protein
MIAMAAALVPAKEEEMLTTLIAERLTKPIAQ